MLGRVQLRELDDPQVNNLFKLLRVRPEDFLVVIAVEYLFVADGPFRRQVENVVCGEGANRDFEATVIASAPTRCETHIITAAGSSPTAITEHRLVLKTGEEMWQLGEAFF